MPEFNKALFQQSLDEWGRYAEAFRRLPSDQQVAFLHEQGYVSLHDLLAHVAVWWEEAHGIIRDRLEHGKRPSRKYDFDEFNAASLARFKDVPQADFMTWYESQRRLMVALVADLTDDQMQVPRVYNWLDGVILEHLKEHGVGAPRFLTIDMLQRQWNGYPDRFSALSQAAQEAFLEKQGFVRFRDVVAHVIAWWEQGLFAIETSSDEKLGDVQDVDAFNAEAVESFGKKEQAAVFADFERTRLALIRLVEELPEDVLTKPNVQAWLRADVLAHYYDHAV